MIHLFLFENDQKTIIEQNSESLDARNQSESDERDKTLVDNELKESSRIPLVDRSKTLFSPVINTKMYKK